MLISLLSNVRVLATGQEPDILIYRDKTYDLCCLPLAQHPEKESFVSEKLFKSNEVNTGNWRGSILTWIISKGNLYLIGLQNSSKTEQVDLKKLFGSKCVDGRVLADWFTGPLYCGIGKIVYYVHDGFNYSYEKELEISIQNGVYISEKINDNSKSRQVDYDMLFTSSYSRPNGYQEHIDSLINWKVLPSIDEKGIRSVVTFSANEDGVIDDIRVVRSGGEVFDNEVIRIVKTLPANVQFYHGKLQRIYYTFPIMFTESKRLSRIRNK